MCIECNRVCRKRTTEQRNTHNILFITCTVPTTKTHFWSHWAFSQSCYVHAIHTHKTYQNVPQSLLSNLITVTVKIPNDSKNVFPASQWWALYICVCHTFIMCRSKHCRRRIRGSRKLRTETLFSSARATTWEGE